MRRVAIAGKIVERLGLRSLKLLGKNKESQPRGLTIEEGRTHRPLATRVSGADTSQEKKRSTGKRGQRS